jgi:hypothetical protein
MNKAASLFDLRTGTPSFAKAVKSVQIVLAELDQGGRVDTRIEGVDKAYRQKIKLGMATTILHRGGGRSKGNLFGLLADVFPTRGLT